MNKTGTCRVGLHFVMLEQTDENARCKQLLTTLAAGSPVHGGLAYQTELTQVNLDFSRQSLARLDEWLQLIRQRDKVSFKNLSADMNFTWMRYLDESI